MLQIRDLLNRVFVMQDRYVHCAQSFRHGCALTIIIHFWNPFEPWNILNQNVEPPMITQCTDFF